MKLIKDIFGRIWAFWALILFVVTMIIFMIPFLLFSYSQKDPLRTKRFISFSRWWMAVWLNGVGCHLTVKGKKNFKKDEQYIVICNHNALIDIPISSPAIPGGNKTIAKSEMASVPVFGLLYTTGSVLVDRKSERSRKMSYVKMKEVLNMGLHMCIYPEGTRNKTDQPLKSFHDGAFKLAIETKKAIIPGIIFNTKKATPEGKKFFLWPTPLSIHFLEPIAIQPSDTTETVREKAYKIMHDYYVANAK